MNFNSEYSILYIVLSFIFAIIISYIFYRKINLSNTTKIFLICLRTLSIFLILFLLLVSYIIFKKSITEKPVNIFLIDNSLSMTLEKRQDELKRAVEIIDRFENNYSENKFYTFSDDIIKEIEKKDLQNYIIDSNSCNSTNISKTLNSVVKIFGDRKISTVNILSDGIINEGGNPIDIAKQTDATFNYLLFGDTIQKTDLVIRNIFFNPTTFSGSNTKILNEFNSYNYSKHIRINLYEEDNLIQSKEFQVNKENTSFNYTFDIKSDNEGIKKYKIELEREPDELTYKNNSEEFFIEYLSNKFKVLVISGNPSPDFSFLSESIKSLNNFETKFFTQKTPGSFYEGQLPLFDEYNLLLLINFPNSFTEINLLSKINDDLKKIKLPVFFISGSNTDYEKIKILLDFLPLSSISPAGNEEKSSVKSITNFYSSDQDYFSIDNSINNLPEIFMPGISFVSKVESKTILISSKTLKPVLIYLYSSDRNSACLLAYNFYKWRLNNTNNEKNNPLEKILSGVAQNICDKEKNKKITFNLSKQVFSPIEDIIVNGMINLSEQTGNESIKLYVYNNIFNKEFEITKTSSNGFTGKIKNLTKGEYNIKCSLIQNGSEIAYDIKKILIEEPNLEYKITKSDINSLNNLSLITGGDRISDSNWNEVEKRISKKNANDLKIQTGIKKTFLNSSLFILIFLIVTFSIEWFLRKRMNLP
jgi:hypothetical protein